jgi:hypothetical protein
MLTETLLRISSLLLVDVLDWPTSHWLQGKNAQELISQAASGMIKQNHRYFQCQNRRFKDFEADYWKESNFKGTS